MAFEQGAGEQSGRAAGPGWCRHAASIGAVFVVGTIVCIILAVDGKYQADLVLADRFEATVMDLARAMNNSFSATEARLQVIGATLTAAENRSAALEDRTQPAAISTLGPWGNDNTNLFAVVAFASVVRPWERAAFEPIISKRFAFIPPGNHTISGVSSEGSLEENLGDRPYYLAYSTWTSWVPGLGLSTTSVGYDLLTSPARRQGSIDCVASRRIRSQIINILDLDFKTLALFAPVFASAEVEAGAQPLSLEDPDMWYDNDTIPVRGVIVGALNSDSMVRARLSGATQGRSAIFIVSEGNPALASADANGDAIIRSVPVDMGELIFAIKLDAVATTLGVSAARDMTTALVSRGALARSFQLRLADRQLGIHVFATDEFMATASMDNVVVWIVVVVAATVVIALGIAMVMHRYAEAYERARAARKAAALRAHVTQEAFLAVTRFACHELRNPSQVVEMAGDLIQHTLTQAGRALKRTDGTGVTDALAIIRRGSRDVSALRDSSKLLSSLLSQLDDVHSLQSEAPNIRLSLVPVRKYIDSAARIATQLTRAPIRVCVDASVPTDIVSCSTRFKQLLLRGLSDASSAAQTGTISVKAWVESRCDAETPIPALARNIPEGPVVSVDLPPVAVPDRIDPAAAEAVSDSLFASTGDVACLRSALGSLRERRGRADTAPSSHPPSTPTSGMEAPDPRMVMMDSSPLPRPFRDMLDTVVAQVPRRWRWLMRSLAILGITPDASERNMRQWLSMRKPLDAFSSGAAGEPPTGATPPRLARPFPPVPSVSRETIATPRTGPPQRTRACGASCSTRVKRVIRAMTMPFLIIRIEEPLPTTSPGSPSAPDRAAHGHAPNSPLRVTTTTRATTTPPAVSTIPVAAHAQQRHPHPHPHQHSQHDRVEPLGLLVSTPGVMSGFQGSATEPSRSHLGPTELGRPSGVGHGLAGRWFNSALELAHARAIAQLLGGNLALYETSSSTVYELAIPVIPPATVLIPEVTSPFRRLVDPIASSALVWARLRNRLERATGDSLQTDHLASSTVIADDFFSDKDLLYRLVTVYPSARARARLSVGGDDDVGSRHSRIEEVDEDSERSSFADSSSGADGAVHQTLAQHNAFTSFLQATMSPSAIGTSHHSPDQTAPAGAVATAATDSATSGPSDTSPSPMANDHARARSPGAGAGATRGTAVHARGSEDLTQRSAATTRFRPNVLAVDDERLILGMTQRAIEHLGWSCEVATDGIHVEGMLTRRNQLPARPLAAPHTAERRIDVVLMDIVMIQSNGADVCARLRALGATLPILAVTSNTSPADCEIYRSCGFDGLLAKPVSSRSLASTITSVLTDPGWVCPVLFPTEDLRYERLMALGARHVAAQSRDGGNAAALPGDAEGGATRFVPEGDADSASRGDGDDEAKYDG